MVGLSVSRLDGWFFGRADGPSVGSPLDDGCDRSVSLSVGWPVCRPTDYADGRSFGRSVDHLVGRNRRFTLPSFGRSSAHSVDRSFGRSLSRSIDLSLAVSLLVCRLLRRSLGGSVGWSIGRSVGLSVGRTSTPRRCAGPDDEPPRDAGRRAPMNRKEGHCRERLFAYEKRANARRSDRKPPPPTARRRRLPSF